MLPGSMSEKAALSSSAPRLLDQVRATIRVHGYSRRTEKAYVAWIRRFVRFHGVRHPRELGEMEVSAFLTYLAVGRRVSASTQNQALSAILFLYRKALKIELGCLDDLVRARRPSRLPVALTRSEVAGVLDQMDGIPWLMASLLYGSGLRVLECARLRVKDIDLDRREVVVREGKGRKDRMTRSRNRFEHPSVSNSSARDASIIGMWPGGWGVSNCRRRSSGSIRAPPGNGDGNGSSPRRGSTGIR